MKKDGPGNPGPKFKLGHYPLPGAGRAQVEALAAASGAFPRPGAPFAFPLRLH